MSVTFVGDFREFGRGAGSPSILRARGLMNETMKETVAGYLESGVMVAATPGSEPDVIDGSVVRGSFSYQTDGVYIWRHDLAHYVRKYGIGLPVEFLSHVSAAGRPPSALSEDEISDIGRWLRAEG